MKTLKTLIALFALLTATFVFADWSVPAASPPTCAPGSPGCDPPINTGAATQAKLGALSIGGNFNVGASSALKVDVTNSRVGIGTASPATMLHLNSAAGAGTTQNDLRVSRDNWGIQLSGGLIQNQGAFGLLRTLSNGGVEGANIELYQQTGANNAFYDADNHTFRSVDGGAVRATIDSTGKIQAAGDVCSTSAGKCLSTAGGGSSGVTSISAGTGITLTPNPITSTGSVGADFTTTQHRVSGACAGSNAIQTISQNGTVTCVATGSSGSGDNLGNHTATQALNMNSFGINNSGDITGRASLPLVLQSSGGANIELYPNQNAFYDADTHNFRSGSGGSTKMTIDSSGVNVSVPLTLSGLNGGSAAGRALMSLDSSGQAVWGSPKPIKYDYAQNCTISSCTSMLGTAGITWSVNNPGANDATLVASCPTNYYAVGGLSCRISGTYRLSGVNYSRAANGGKDWTFQCMNSDGLAWGKYLDMIETATITCIPATAF